MLDSVKELAGQIERQTRESNPNEVDLLVTGLSLCYAGFELANYYPAETHDQLLGRKGLVAQNYISLNAASILAISGFYIQSLGMMKNVYENWLAFWYLAKFPNDAHFWLDPDWDKRPPKAETMRNKIDHEQVETKSKLKAFYNEMNRFAHTDPVAVLDRYVASPEGPAVSVDIAFSSKDFEACVYWLSLWIGNTLDALSVWIPQEDDWHQQHSDHGEQIVNYLQVYNSRD